MYKNYVYHSKINPWIQGNYIYAQTNSEKIPCDVIYLLSIPELCWLKTTYFLNLYLQNRKSFSTRFASLPHFTTLPRFRIIECINQWENKQLFRIFIFENGSCHVCRIIYTHNFFTRPQYLICFKCFYCHYVNLHLYKRTKQKKINDPSVNSHMYKEYLLHFFMHLRRFKVVEFKTFRNEINTHCQLFTTVTHYRSSPGN